MDDSQAVARDGFQQRVNGVMMCNRMKYVA